MAIERHIAMAFRPTEGDSIRIWSEHFKEEFSFRPHSLLKGSVSGWAAYPAGMCWALQMRGHKLSGMDVAISTDIPVGAGVSSSAALEVSFGLALSDANDLRLSPSEIAEVSHVADNEFVGIPSGIMDQFASALCERGHALLIDCRSKASEQVPIPDEIVFVVMDTGRRRGLVDSEYAARVAACRRVAAAVRALRPEVTALRDVTHEDLESVRGTIDDIDLRRASHVIDENKRTLEACERLRSGDVEGFGGLMIKSHESLRDLYQVSCAELDLAVDIALQEPGCLGARMTGGGFGGCALALVEQRVVDAFIERVQGRYAAGSDFEGSFFAVRPADGAKVFSTT